MLIINFSEYEAQIKIVYYGPGMAGKTTSLQYLAKRLKVEVVEKPTLSEDRTVFLLFADKSAVWHLEREIQFLYPPQSAAIAESAVAGSERCRRYGLRC